MGHDEEKPRSSRSWQPWKVSLLALTVTLALAPAALLLVKSEIGSLRLYTPTYSFSHVHGLALDPTDPQTLYVATHQGLVKSALTGPDTQTIAPESIRWILVGRDRSDLMGFAMHPHERIMYSSGHPPEGGNWGLRISTDGGLSWQILALEGAIDFHAMAISPVDPQIMYGWDSWTMRLLRSADGGRSWERPSVSGLPPMVFSLAADPVEVQGLWAGTDQGLYRSHDRGETWDLIPSLAGVEVTALAFHSAQPQTLYAYVAKRGLLLSSDRGRSWRSLGHGIPEGAAITYLVIDPIRPQVLYAASRSAALYRSIDGGRAFSLLKSGE
jgi:hypothetical protein